MKNLSRNGLKIIIISLFFFLLSCGHKKNPTGGPKDTVKPKIISTEPIQFSKIDKTIKIIFSKPILKTTVSDGILIYPPIIKKRFSWLSNNELQIEIKEPLSDSTNYFFNFFPAIKGIHQNPLDKYYLFVFNSGKLQDYTIYGRIDYETNSDANKSVNLTLFSKDSLFVLKKIVNSSDFKIEHLNNDKYFLKAYIDKNSNDKYDFGKEPFDKITISDTNRTNVKLYLAYSDTTAPHLKNIISDYEGQLTVKFSEPVKTFEKFEIIANDTLKSPLAYIDYKLSNDSLIIITQKPDTSDYLFKIFNFEDKKNNKTKFDSLTFAFSSKIDSLPPKIISLYPDNGRIVIDTKPQIKVKFNELIKNIHLSLLDEESNKKIAVFQKSNEKNYFVFYSKDKLKPYFTYKLELSFSDYAENKGKYISKFIIKEK